MGRNARESNYSRIGDILGTQARLSLSTFADIYMCIRPANFDAGCDGSRERMGISDIGIYPQLAVM